MFEYIGAYLGGFEVCRAIHFTDKLVFESVFYQGTSNIFFRVNGYYDRFTGER